jgi:peptidoglycan/LPS O-acetylase OafA/YrhL
VHQIERHSVVNSVSGRSLGHLAAIDGLRAISIVVVMAYHFSLGLKGGFLGVDLFFAISGFVITRGLLVSAASETSTRQLLQAFYRRRVWRLWPALFALLLAVLVVGFVLKPSFWEEPSVTLRNAIAAVFAGGNWFQVATPDPAAGLFRPLIHMWSLSIEEQFYLVLPAIVLLGRRQSQRVAAALGFFTLGAPVVAAMLSPNSRWSFFATPARIGPIGAGVLVAVVLATSSGWEYPRKASASVFAGIGFGCAVAFAVLTLGASWEQRWLWRIGYAALPILYGVLVWSTAQSQQSWWGSLLSLPAIQWLGSRSYSIYLVHFPLSGLLYRGGQTGPHLERVGLLVISLLVAELSFRFVESPFRIRGTAI